MVSPENKNKPSEKSFLRAFLGSILVFALATAPSSAETRGWEMAFQKGEKALADEKPELAELNFRRALKLVKTQSSKQTDIEKCMLKLAASLALLDKTSEARTMYLDLLRRFSGKYGSKSTQVEPLLMALGSIEESAGDHTTAMSYYNRALTINEQNYGTYSPAYARTLHRLGRVNYKLGDQARAAQHYKGAISILSKSPNEAAGRQLKQVMKDYDDLLKGNDNSNQDLIKDFQKDVFKGSSNSSPNSSDGQQLSGNARKSRMQVWDSPAPSKLRPAIGTKKGDSRAGQSQFAKQSEFQLNASRQQDTDENRQVALRGLQRLSSDRTLAPAYRVVNDTIFKQPRYAQSESQYKRKIAIDIDALGPHHPSVANDLNSLAQLYIKQEKYEDARPLLTRALRIYDSTYGTGNLLTISTRASLAAVEFHLGNTDRAAELYRDALSQGQSSLGPNSLETAKILNGLAYLYFHQGKLQQSATFYEWAVSSTESAVGHQAPLLAACLQDYARVLRGLGKSTKAKEVELRASSILARSR